MAKVILADVFDGRMSKVTNPQSDEHVFKEAERKFDAYLARRRKKGEHVRVLMHPYRTAQVCAMLQVGGGRERVYFCESKDGWRKA